MTFYQDLTAIVAATYLALGSIGNANAEEKPQPEKTAQKELTCQSELKELDSVAERAPDSALSFDAYCYKSKDFKAEITFSSGPYVSLWLYQKNGKIFTRFDIHKTGSLFELIGVSVKTRSRGFLCHEEVLRKARDIEKGYYHDELMNPYLDIDGSGTDLDLDDSMIRAKAEDKLCKYVHLAAVQRIKKYKNTEDQEERKILPGKQEQLDLLR